MQKYLRLAGNDILVNYYEGFREKLLLLFLQMKIKLCHFGILLIY